MSVSYRMRRAALCLLLGFITIQLGCTHLEYSRTWETGRADIDPEEFGTQAYDHEDHGMNELVWLDPSGAVCGGVTTGLDAINSATEARNEAVKQGKSTYSYEYNIYAPVAGLYCGGYFRWGTGLSTGYGAPAMNAAQEQGADITLDSRFRELGFHASGTEQFKKFNWMTYSFGFRLGMGRYRWLDEDQSERGQLKDDEGPFLFRMPLFFGLGFYAPFLRGLGFEAQGGTDPIGLALTSGNGKVWQKWDARAMAKFQFVRDPVIFTVSAGYERNSTHWGEYWLRRRGPFAATSVTFLF